QRCPVSSRSQQTGPAHAFELVVGFYGAVVVQAAQQVRRVEAIAGGRDGVRADVGDTAESRPVIGCLEGVFHGDQIDLRRPRLARQGGRLMPIIVWPVKQD